MASTSILANYHTHTPLCNHAEGSPETYIQTALRCGYQVLGFADHTPWRYKNPDFVSRIRMTPDLLELYVSSLRQLGQKYADRLHLHIGLEAEYFPDYMGWLLEEKERLGIEYLIFGCHYDRTDEGGLYFGRSDGAGDFKRYVELAIAGMETGAYCCLAHPDLFLNNYPAFDADAKAASRAICEAAAQLDIPLEYNMAGPTRRNLAAGRLGYTTPEFWQVAAEYPVKVILGCDAHRPAELNQVAGMARCREKLRQMGLTVLDTLPGLE